MEYDNLIGTELEMFTAADVDPKEINWLWYPYIPFGKVTVLAGDSGDGKSTFALNLAALFTRGGKLPFTEASIEPMNVIYLNSEDAADDTVVPRFMKANGVRDRLFFISEEKQKLNFADRRIRQAIEEKGARVVILDPLVSYLGHDVSMNLGNEVRPRTEYLIEAARETGCAIIIFVVAVRADLDAAVRQLRSRIHIPEPIRSHEHIHIIDQPSGRGSALPETVAAHGHVNGGTAGSAGGGTRAVRPEGFGEGTPSAGPEGCY